MSDAIDLVWKLGARVPGHDYRIFTTAFVDGTNPQTGATKRFSLIDSVDWVNVIALTADDRGYTGGNWELIGRVRPNPAIQNNTLFTVLARGVARTQPATPDAGEVLAVETATLAECRRRLLAGDIDHALVVVAFAHLALRQHELAAP